MSYLKSMLKSKKETAAVKKKVWSVHTCLYLELVHRRESGGGEGRGSSHLITEEWHKNIFPIESMKKKAFGACFVPVG